MANRVTAQQLADTIGVQSLDGLDSFISDAHLLVDQVLLPLNQTAAQLMLMEKYLAAHLWVISAEKGGLTLSRVDDAEERYVNSNSAGKSPVGLRSTRFGMLLVALDTTRALVKLFESSRQALFRVA